MTRVQIEEVLCKSLIMPLDVKGLGCRWTVNPYLGCGHVCFQCLFNQTGFLTQRIRQNYRLRLMLPKS